MLRAISKVVITQVTQIVGKPTRNKQYTFDFVNNFTCSDNWRDMTNEGSIVLPRNLYIRDENNKLVSIYGTNKNMSGFSNENPILMRGDKVTIDYGYKYFKNGKEIFEGTENISSKTHLFEGWVSEVLSKKTIEFKVEDNMWKLKQTPAPTKTFKATETLEDIMTYLLKDTPFKVNALTKTTFGSFMVGNETVAEVLGRLRKAYHFENYFKGDELRVGSAIYIESEANKREFQFQQNIISDDLIYKRKDDLVLSIAASNNVEEDTGAKTKDGHIKTKSRRLEVLVTMRLGSDTPNYYVKRKGQDYPPNQGGERMTLTYPGAKNIDDLVKLASAELKKYYYTGFKGKFTTFGIPYTKMGDIVVLKDPILPERNGAYRVRGVEYSGGMGGLRQVIELDYKILE